MTPESRGADGVSRSINYALDGADLAGSITESSLGTSRTVRVIGTTESAFR